MPPCRHAYASAAVDSAVAAASSTTAAAPAAGAEADDAPPPPPEVPWNMQAPDVTVAFAEHVGLLPMNRISVVMVTLALPGVFITLMVPRESGA